MIRPFIKIRQKICQKNSSKKFVKKICQKNLHKIRQKIRHGNKYQGTSRNFKDPTFLSISTIFILQYGFLEAAVS